ncbi:hypothetical protein LEN26_002950 [Aphanomyces euteiches]|nr:hypothetical protein LEN26_002950 [Aphanomyces euteiches]KAH9182916.1 hypothetical protein AeNC1_015108 [Aphanomyces euteiches]
MDNATSSMILATWIWLVSLTDTNLLSGEEKASFKSKWTKQLEKFKGVGLSAYGRRLALQTVLELGERQGFDKSSIMDEYQEFSTKSKRFKSEWQWGDEYVKNPIQFWQSYMCHTLQPVNEVGQVTS